MMRFPRIVKVFLKHFYRRKSTLFWTIVFPILLITIFGSIFSNMGQSKVTLYVQNLDVKDGQPSHMSQGLINALNSTEAFQITLVNSTQNLDDILNRASNPRALIIQEGFGRDSYQSTQRRSVTSLTYSETGHDAGSRSCSRHH